MASERLPDRLSTRPLDRHTVERVLARAAELHEASAASHASIGSSTDTSAEMGITESQLLDIAREVGLPEASVRQALAEERTRVPITNVEQSLQQHLQRGAWLTRMTGPGVLTATRAMRGNVSTLLAALDTWMQQEESLTVQRQLPDRIIWEPRRDWVAIVRRRMNFGGRAYVFTRAKSIAATLTSLGDDHVAVRLDVDLSPIRDTYTAFTITTGSLGVLSAGALVALGVSTDVTGAMMVVAGVPIVAAAGGVFGLRRRYCTTAERMAIALEQVLDRIEYNDVRISRLWGGG